MSSSDTSLDILSTIGTLLTRAVLWQEEPRSAVNFDTYRIVLRHRAISLPLHFLMHSRCRLSHSAAMYIRKATRSYLAPFHISLFFYKLFIHIFSSLSCKCVH